MCSCIRTVARLWRDLAFTSTRRPSSASPTNAMVAPYRQIDAARQLWSLCQSEYPEDLNQESSVLRFNPIAEAHYRFAGGLAS